MNTVEKGEDNFLQHAALVFRQELGITVAQARWIAWCEGPEGYAKRLEAEQDKQGED